mmetsp:Transcript_3600/g.5231  ORF Transcript_3600/g.5231 Transcript_3600/m.5231 type:complete len:224 (+) Transcript_3600:3-674(+)
MFNYQMEYNENELAENEDFDSMLHALEIKMAQRIVNRSSIFPECNDPEHVVNISSNETETPGLSSRPKDLVSTKDCINAPSDAELKCVVMEGQMTFFYPESRKSYFVPKLREYNNEIRLILSNGMDAYLYDHFHTIRGIHKLKYLTKVEYDRLPLRTDVVSDSDTNNSDSKPRGRGAGARVGIAFLSLVIISAALFGVYYVWKKKSSGNSSTFDGSNGQTDVV